MRILSAITNALRSFFGVTNQEWAYRQIMLIVSLIVTTLGFIGYGFIAQSTHSFLLSIILFSTAFLNVVNLILIKNSRSFKFSSYFFVIIYSLSMAYLVFDGGRSGYGYIWFYSIPVVNISILGVKRHYLNI